MATLSSLLGACALLVVSGPGATAKTMVNAADNAEMIWIPEGPFVMGSDDGRDNEGPAHTVTLSGYWIYKTEVSVAQYMAFVGATGRQTPSEPPYGFVDNYPVVYTNWEDAVAYCEWTGGALPTEAQWEKAARGTDGRTFPWGNDYIEQNAQASAGRTPEPAPVDSLPAGASPFGVLHMTGNVSEWANDHYLKDYYANSPATDPTGPDRGQRVVRGGDHKVGNQARLTTFTRGGKTDTTKGGTTGFRCAHAG